MTGTYAAAYEGLLPPQQKWFDHLMSSQILDWPESLKAFLGEKKPGCGDEWAHWVGVWVKAQRD